MIFFTSGLRRAVTVSVAAVAMSVATVSEAIAQTLNGAGASFPRPLYERYFAEYRRETGVTVNYNSVGSGAGIRQFIGETVDFAGSDAPPKPSEINQMTRGVIMVPTAGGAVALAYNLPGVTNLRIPREVLPQIFSGAITNWRQVDPSLPDMTIRPVVRADGSGTTFIFTSHLSAVSDAFERSIGANKAPSWPSNFLKGPKNDGVAATIRQTRGAIGYVQDTYARQNNIPTAWLENQAGRFVEPSLAEANKALEGVRFNSDFTTANADDPNDGYPIVGVTWLLVYRRYQDAQTAEAVKNMVEWILTRGQRINGQLEYTRIPAGIAQRAMRAVNSNVASTQ